MRFILTSNGMSEDTLCENNVLEVLKQFTEPRKKIIGKLITAGLLVTIGVTVFHSLPILAAGIGSGKVVSAMVMDPSFQSQLSIATKPIKDVIFAFGHEAYFVFMSWGAIEALIGKPQQGFARMKVSTASYILLYWIPMIVDMVNDSLPKG